MPDNQLLWNKVCSFQNLKTAWNKVNANKGSPGIDRITLEDFKQNLDENLKTLQDQLENSEYKPLPVLRIYIDKDDGTKRSIGISAVKDRIIQQALRLVISPIFEQIFLDCSFAYRPGRSTHDAISQIETLLNDGLIWVLDGEKTYPSLS